MVSVKVISVKNEKPNNKQCNDQLHEAEKESISCLYLKDVLRIQTNFSFFIILRLHRPSYIRVFILLFIPKSLFCEGVCRIRQRNFYCIYKVLTARTHQSFCLDLLFLLNTIRSFEAIHVCSLMHFGFIPRSWKFVHSSHSLA